MFIGVHKSQQLAPTLSQINPICNLPSCLSFIFIRSTHLQRRHPNDLVLSKFLHQTSTCIAFLPNACHTSSLTLSSEQYLANSKNHEARHYSVSNSFSLLPPFWAQRSSSELHFRTPSGYKN